MALCKNRLERKGGKFIAGRRCHGIAIWSGWRADKRGSEREEGELSYGAGCYCK